MERPLDDYESLCALQKLNGVDLGETYLTRSACTDFIDHISSVIKDDLADNLKGCNVFSLMIDGSTDHGVIEEAIETLSNHWRRPGRGGDCRDGDWVEAATIWRVNSS